MNYPFSEPCRDKIVFRALTENKLYSINKQVMKLKLTSGKDDSS